MTDDQTKTRKSAYLSVLPAGWAYIVQITGPDGQSVRVLPNVDNGVVGRPDSPHEIVTVTSDGAEHVTEAESLDAALKKAAKGIRALAAVAEQEAEAKKAREAAVAALGSVIEGDIEDDIEFETVEQPDAGRPALNVGP